MAKFCKKCGAKLDDKTGRCPNCDKVQMKHENEEKAQKETASNNKASEQKKAAKARKKQKKAEKKEKLAKLPFSQRLKKRLGKGALILLAIVIVIGGALAILNHFGYVNTQYLRELLPISSRDAASTDAQSEEDTEEFYTVDAPDAEAYYAANAQIVSEIDAADFPDVPTEAEAHALLKDRGFADEAIMVEYSMEGEYMEATTASSDSDEKHPMYQSQYFAENGDLWTIFVINGKVMANPVSYNMASELGVQVIVSESESVTSYDGTTNKFFETIPDEEALRVIVAEKIDARTLDDLTVEEIDGHV